MFHGESSSVLGLGDGQGVFQEGCAVWRALEVKSPEVTEAEHVLGSEQPNLGVAQNEEESRGVQGGVKWERALSVRLANWDWAAMEGLGAEEGAGKGT